MRTFLVALIAVVATVQVHGQSTLTRLQQQNKMIEDKINAIKMQGADLTNLMRQNEEDDWKARRDYDIARVAKLAKEESERNLKKQQAREELRKVKEANNRDLKAYQAKLDEEYFKELANVQKLKDSVKADQDFFNYIMSADEWDHRQAKQQYEQQQWNNKMKEEDLDKQLAGLRKERRQIEAERQQQQQKTVVTHTYVVEE